MVIPSFFIVGAPRCGTSSLFAYLDAHPRIYACEPKEPYHFNSDIALSWRPFADRRDYLQLFAGAREHQVAGEATVLYLYSKAALRGIQALSPSARIIIMLRDPVEVLQSYHALNLLLLNEDLEDLERALAAEEDRRAGRRIPWTCETPFALQYSTIVRYAEHVQRYLEAFGPDRVKCILFDDLKREPTGSTERRWLSWGSSRGACRASRPTTRHGAGGAADWPRSSCWPTAPGSERAI